MKQLSVPLIDMDVLQQDLRCISEVLDKQESHLIPFAPWPAFPSKPDARFSIAHSRDFFLIKFYVKEKWLLAANMHYNSAVYEDSCVECFLAFGDDQQVLSCLWLHANRQASWILLIESCS